MKTLRIGRQSAGFLARGHPWVRRDRFTRGLDGCRPGEAVTLVDERGRRLASALADPTATVCARVYHRRPDRPFDPAAAVARAWARRDALHHDPTTTCYRLVHGEADFLPGVIVDRLGPALVVTLRADCALNWEAALGRALRTHMPAAEIVIREHTDDLRREAVALRHDDGSPVDPRHRVEASELGLALRPTPAAGLATGVYVDQRGTRAWLRARCHEARVLNLFAYTGLFSLSLLAAGAATAADVDLSAPALAEAAASAARNRLADRHRAIKADCFAFLAEDRNRYDIAICDPPTAARGGGGWVVDRDYPRLLRALAPRLADDGLVIACRNTVGRHYDLAAAVAACPGLEPVPGPDLAGDIPQLRGFPEGRPFDLVAARKRK